MYALYKARVALVFRSHKIDGPSAVSTTSVGH